MAVAVVAGVPVPLKLRVVGTMPKVFAIVSDPTLVPVAVGVKVIFELQVPPGARGDEQLSCSEKSPLAEIFVIVIWPLPLLVIKIGCGELLVPRG